jgi:hypothetical protein
MTNEEILTDFMQKHYSDEQLAALLAHAEDGKLSYWSCCCFIGIATANHPLQSEISSEMASAEPHYMEARRMVNAQEAELAFLQLSRRDSEEGRRAKLIPLIRSEMNRRAELRAQVEESELVTA